MEENSIDVFNDMSCSFNSFEMQSCMKAVDSILGFYLADNNPYAEPFIYFHSYITSPQPEFINNLRSNPRGGKWADSMINGILLDVQNTFCCVLYHYENLVALESNVTQAILKTNYKSVIGNSTVGLGNTLKWDFEYQSFVLALRRCLDYLAKSVSAYFKNDFHSFRRLGIFLEKQKDNPVSSNLKVMHEKYSYLLSFVLSDGERKSVRDRISHYGYVSAGTMNLTSNGISLFGGGEEIGFEQDGVLLSIIIRKHLDNFFDCISDFVHGFVDGMKAHQCIISDMDVNENKNGI